MSALVVQLECSDVSSLRLALTRLSVFSEDQFLQKTVVSWSHASKTRAWSYMGHNVPGEILARFFSKASGLSKLEQRILKVLVDSGCLRCNGNEWVCTKSFYVTGFRRGDWATCRHELSHALFHLIPEFRKTCLDLFRDLETKTKSKVEACLRQRGYPEELFCDEFCAYLLEGDKEILKILRSDEKRTLLETNANRQLHESVTVRLSHELASLDSMQ